MSKFKSAGTIFIYFIAIWHGYVLLARPLIFHYSFVPLNNQVMEYSAAIPVDQSWAYFYGPPKTVMRVYYSSKDKPGVKNFFGSSADFFMQRRFYRCQGCYIAAHQLLYEDQAVPPTDWLIRHYLCPFHAPSDQLSIFVKTAAFNSTDFQTVKTKEILCSDFQ